ncbi:MAG: sigma-70 family RNA polymerase sigma factor [Actinomycetota bacterium]
MGDHTKGPNGPGRRRLHRLHSAGPSSPDDRSLVERHLAGSESAFDTLYGWYHPRLTRFCKRRLRDEAAAEDVAQETLLRALVHLDDFDTSRPLWPWLKTIASNLTVDEVRRRSRLVELDVEAGGPAVEETGGHEERVNMVQALSRIPDSQRTALALKYLEDWDSTESAAFLGMSGQAFRQVLHRGRVRLRLEYRRMAEGVGAVLVPLRLLHRVARRGAARLTAAPQARPLIEGASSNAVQQLAGGVLVMALAVGGVATIGRSPHPRTPTSRQDRPVAVARIHHSRPIRHAPKQHPPAAVRSAPSTPVSPPTSRSERHGDRSAQPVGAIVKDVVDPNRNVKQPEDARGESVAFSPNFGHDATAFMVGALACHSPVCPPVLFESTDGASSWARLPARGFSGTQLLLPPRFGNGDDRLFAMGPGGLQMSPDGGRSFQAVGSVGVPFAVGSAAMSPGFDDLDPSILIGAQMLMRYRDDLGTMQPDPQLTGHGPFNPTFSPSYPSDPRVFVGGTEVNAVTMQVGAVVHVCQRSVCSSSWLPDAEGVPVVRLPAIFSQTGSAFAFTPDRIFGSTDAGGSFSPLPAPWQGGNVWDLAVSDDGNILLAAIAGATTVSTNGLYISADAGATWNHAQSPLLQHGVKAVAASGGRILAVLGDRGIACSSDGGRSWDTRC